VNIKLASMLTEYTIDVFRELDENVADEDIYLDEFQNAYYLVHCLFFQVRLFNQHLTRSIQHSFCRIKVFLKPEEVSLAIGKGGLNIKLASMLTEYTIDVFQTNRRNFRRA